MVSFGDVIRKVEELAPPQLAENWDNSGLQVGDPRSEVRRVLVALSPLEEVFTEAGEKGADALILHHPLIFGQLASVDTSAHPGNLLGRALRSEINIYTAHTSFDAAPNGVSAALAAALDLSGPLEVIRPCGSVVKLAVFVPPEHAEAVSEALAQAGAGRIGNYTRCTFRTPGRGTFLPGERSNPYLGSRGELEEVEEVRLETLVPAHLAHRAAAAAKGAHPYEEAALDLYPVEGYPEGCGYGRTGALPEPLSPEGLRRFVSDKLGFPAGLVANPKPERKVRHVGALGGSGGSFVREAAASGAQAYVTGDLDYHDALLAESLGLVAVDAGHAATELPSLAPLAGRLSRMLNLPVEVSRVRR